MNDHPANQALQGTDEPAVGGFQWPPVHRLVSYGLPCAQCRAYYEAQLAVCPICGCRDRVPAASRADESCCVVVNPKYLPEVSQSTAAILDQLAVQLIQLADAQNDFRDGGRGDRGDHRTGIDPMHLDGAPERVAGGGVEE